ncbi:MAG: diguanylate cyclase [Microbacteriaceae bacterium]|nr:diguanylate cyclase [Burkholderiaceae bacterium]
MTPTENEEYEALLQFMYMAPVGLMQTRHDGEILMVNPLCAQLLMPLSRDGELANLFTLLAGVAPDLRHRTQAFEAPHGMVVEALRLQVGAGQPDRRDARVMSLSLLKLDGERLMAVLSDITEVVKRERELRHSQARINTMVTGITDYALMTLDHAGCVQDWNAGVARVTGCEAEAAAAQPYSIFYPPEGMSPERLHDRLHEAERSGWSMDEGWRERGDGGRYWGSCLIAPLHAADETRAEERGYSLIIRDVSDRREAHEALRRSVDCDHLTGLTNRRAFFAAAELELQRWLRWPRPLSVVMIDADHFKAVNDRHGHPAGDAVLRHLAAGMVANFRAVDIVARIGGEEFLVLLPGTTAESALSVASRLCNTLAAHSVLVDGTAIACTVSAGAAAMDAGVEDLAALIKRADAALYAAKSAGRSRAEPWHSGLTPVPQPAWTAVMP